MKTLSVIKQEAREELDNLFFERVDGVLALKLHNGAARKANIEVFLEGTLDHLVDEVEKVVVPEEALPSDWDDDDKPRLRASMYNRCREEVLEAFTRFKGENV